MTDFFPLRLLLATFAGWVNREQAQVVAFHEKAGDCPYRKLRPSWTRASRASPADQDTRVGVQEGAPTPRPSKE
jgi:hypothetical protein